MDCALRECALDETRLPRARLLDSVLDGVRGVGTDLAGATLRDVELTDARLGGTQLHGAALERVRVRGGKIDFLNLRAAVLKDVVFEGCVLVEPDFAGARLERVEFADCTVKGVDLSGAVLKDVDLRQAASLEIARGVDRLSGAVISTAQLLDLAPSLAGELGITVEGERTGRRPVRTIVEQACVSSVCSAHENLPAAWPSRRVVGPIPSGSGGRHVPGRALRRRGEGGPGRGRVPGPAT